jgi:hypothetical protein
MRSKQVASDFTAPAMQALLAFQIKTNVKIGEACWHHPMSAMSRNRKKRVGDFDIAAGANIWQSAIAQLT